MKTYKIEFMFTASTEDVKSEMLLFMKTHPDFKDWAKRNMTVLEEVTE